MTKPEAEKHELVACVLYELYNEFGKLLKITQWSSEDLGDAYARIMKFAKDYNLSVDKPMPAPNAEPSPEELDQATSEPTEGAKDSRGNVPGQKGFFHVKHAMFEAADKGRVRFKMDFLLRNGEMAKYPFQESEYISTFIKALDGVGINALEAYFDEPHDFKDIDWKVSYEVATGKNTKDNYYRNIYAIEPWSE